MKTNIKRLGRRIINAHRADMTPDELFEIYTKPQDREVLTRVFDLVQLDTSTRSWTHLYKVEKGSVKLSVYMDIAKGDTKWLTPKYAAQGPVEGADPEIVAKLDKWVRKRIELGVECAMIEAVFDELNWRCAGRAAVKFFMPSVLDLLDMIEDDQGARELREKLDTSKVPPLPLLPPEMRSVLPQVSATVARARLMDKKSEDSGPGRVRFAISSPSKGLGETPWGAPLSIV
jgi:hypothetical protein